MSDYNWCHGPNCHTNSTQSRVRGSGDNKVLRTIKINADTEWLRQSVFSHFCNQRCLMDFIKLHKDRIVALDPRTEPLETRIEDPKKEAHMSRYTNYSYTTTTINKIDTDSNVG